MQKKTTLIKMRSTTIAKIENILATTRIHRLFEPFYSGIGHILLFHRILPMQKQPRISNHLGLEITPRQLEQTIYFYQKNDFDFLSLDEFYKRIKQNNLKKKFVVFTFDDGYKDNLTFAYPIFKKYNIPFTIYITTNFPDKEAILWWYLLEEMIRDEQQIQLKWLGDDIRISTQTIQEKELAFDLVRDYILKHINNFNYQELLSSIFEAYQPNLYIHSNTEVLNWEEIQQLSQNPLVTIGAHTVNHYSLRNLKEAELIREVSDSKTLIEQYIQQPVEHFAYPFGKEAQASFREFQIVKNLKFKTATTTRSGNIFYEHSNYLECLPRIHINSKQVPELLPLNVSGILPCLKNKGRKVVTH